jgi:hypothetical protein
MAYDVCHQMWKGTPPLGVIDAFAPICRFEAVQVHFDKSEFPQSRVMPSIQQFFGPEYELTQIVETTHDADTYGYENVKWSGVPTELGGLLETVDQVHGTDVIPKVVIPARPAELNFVALINDFDCRKTFRLRLKPSEKAEPFIVPIVNANATTEQRWSAIITRLRPGALPPGTYSGTLAAIRLFDHQAPRPNLRALYLAVKK